jgi:hypothetical protein
MKRTLVAVADLGRFKAFELLRGEGDSRAHLELLEKKEQPEAISALSEQVTDSAGRFPRVTGPRDSGRSGMSMGDRHDLKLEQQRRAMHSVAQELNGLLAGDEFDTCWLAAGKSVLPALLDCLRPAARAKVKRSLHLDLTKSHPDEVLGHFEAARKNHP